MANQLFRALLRQSYGEERSDLIVIIEESIEKYDIFLNPNALEAIYVSEDLWRRRNH